MGKQILLSLLQNSTWPGSAIREGRRQWPGPARAAGGCERAPAPEEPVTDLSVALRHHLGLSISVQQRESGSLALGESQDTEADS